MRQYLRNLVYQTEKLTQRARFASAILNIENNGQKPCQNKQNLVAYQKTRTISARNCACKVFFNHYFVQIKHKNNPAGGLLGFPCFFERYQPGRSRPESLRKLNWIDVVAFILRIAAEIEFPDIAARFAPYLGWLEHPEVLSLHFEDLILNRPAALNQIINHFLARVPLETSPETIREALETSINPQKSPTFRSGKTGEWKKHFNKEHKTLFKDVAGDLLVRLGYETDLDW